ncbi:MAG: four helix bundle protein [Candidatus Margulisbacteria bacterium]|nr:four helix bundle protein [Candidatus Margulisiibacteriota bacterium]
MAFRFLSFPVYKDVRNFIKEIYAISGKFPKEEQFGLTNQLRRAVISIALNIAEGSDRGSDNEFKRFIDISIGSLNEVIAILDIASDNGFIKKDEYDIMVVKAEHIVKQLSGFKKSLVKNSRCK